jgi:UDP-N-acetylglucosamine--N-acetylmuramyl-(pentapeptide) pyrophosphoryl-undecaprenol N-acetylglucosamine transferase
MRKDIYIHESDTVTGLANKVISRFATKVFYTFKNDLTHPPVSDEESEGIDEDTTPDISTPIQKYIHTGPIVNPELIDYLDSLEVEENERFTIMVIAGSQ